MSARHHHLLIVAACCAVGCGTAVRPSPDAAVVPPSDAAAEDRVVTSDAASADAVPDAGDGGSAPDVSALPDVVEDVLPEPRARIIVSNTSASATEWDSIEAARLRPATLGIVMGAWSQASGACTVDNAILPAYESLGMPVRFTVGADTLTPELRRDGRQVWRPMADVLQPGMTVGVTVTNSHWSGPWSTNITVPPFVRVTPLPPEFRISRTDSISVSWDADRLPPTARVEVHVLDQMYNADLMGFDYSVVRCEYPPSAGAARIRLADHRTFRFPRDRNDSMLLTVNVVERRVVAFPEGAIELFSRSESAAAPVIIVP
jgi:hypothetical protein